MSNRISRNPTLPKWMLCTYNHGIHVCSMHTYLKPFWKKTLWKHHPKTRTNGGRHELPKWIRLPGPSWRTPSPSTISPLPYWPSLSSGRVRFWEISPPKKGSNYFLDKRNLFWKPQIFGKFFSYNIDPNKTQLGLGHHPLTAKMNKKNEHQPSSLWWNNQKNILSCQKSLAKRLQFCNSHASATAMPSQSA